MKKTTAILLLSLLLFCFLAFFRLGQAGIRMPHESRILTCAITPFVTSRNHMQVLRSLKMLWQAQTAMEVPFAGNLTVLLSVLSMMIFGPGLFALRCMYTICSILSMFCLFYVLSRWFDEWVGALTVLLLSVDPIFIIMTRFGGERDEILQICLLWTGLACIELSAGWRKKILLYLSGFVFGLALWAKLLFLGYFFGVLGVLILCGQQNRRKIALRYNLGLKDFVFWSAAFCAGCLPLIIYNIAPQTFLETFRMLLGSLFSPTTTGRNNLEVLMNVIERFKHLHSFAVHISGYYNFYLALPFICFFIGRALMLNRYFSRWIIGGVLVAYSICFFLSSFVPVYAEPFQLLILWPVAQIVLALSMRIAYLHFRARGNFPGMSVAFICVIFVLFHCSQLYAFSVKQTKSIFNMSTSTILFTNETRNLYYIADFLKTKPKSRVYSSSVEISDVWRIINGDIFNQDMVFSQDVDQPLVIDEPVFFVLLQFRGSASNEDHGIEEQYFDSRYVDAELIYYSSDFANNVRGYVFCLSPKNKVLVSD